MKEKISIRFHQALNDFLPAENRESEIIHELKQPRSIKDLFESIGVPHTEVDLVMVNDRPVDFTYPVQPGDRIGLYPLLNTEQLVQLNVSPLIHNQPEPPGTPRFVLDVHLGRLAAYLRMLGFDTLYRNDYQDSTLAEISAAENRILLTCDRQLLMRKQVVYGYFVRQRQPKKQLLEVISRFGLYNKQKPFSRCMHCNGTTTRVDKYEIENQILAKTEKYYDEFYQCGSCKKIYWKGSHYKKMQKMIEDINRT